MSEIDYSKLQGLEILDAQFLNEVEELSAGLSLEEIQDLANIKMADLNELEIRYLNLAFKRGRIKAKRDAINALFTEMRNGRNATQASLSYLTRFADEFKDGAQVVGNGFTLKVEGLDG